MRQKDLLHGVHPPAELSHLHTCLVLLQLDFCPRLQALAFASSKAQSLATTPTLMGITSPATPTVGQRCTSSRDAGSQSASTSKAEAEGAPAHAAAAASITATASVMAAAAAPPVAVAPCPEPASKAGIQQRAGDEAGAENVNNNI